MKQIKVSASITPREGKALEKYLLDIGKIPLLSAEEEAELARRIKTGDEKALEELVRKNLRFVVSVAKKYFTDVLRFWYRIYRSVY